MDDIARLRASIRALSAVISALVETHPNRELLAKRIEEFGDAAINSALPQAVEDEEIEALRYWLSAHVKLARPEE